MYIYTHIYIHRCPYDHIQVKINHIVELSDKIVMHPHAPKPKQKRQYTVCGKRSEPGGAIPWEYQRVTFRFMFSATSTHFSPWNPRFHFAALQVSHRADQTARAQKKEETCEEFSWGPRHVEPCWAVKKSIFSNLRGGQFTICFPW